MTAGKASPYGDRTSDDAETRLDRVHQDMEIIFRHMAGQPSPARSHHADTSSNAREIIPPLRRRGRLRTRVVALTVFGLALMACLVGALAFMKQSDTSMPRVATRPSTDASRAAPEPSASDFGRTAGTISNPQAKSIGPNEGMREEPTSRIIPADASAPSSSAAPTRSEPRTPSSVVSAGDAGEGVIRAFYGALGRGDGKEASAHVVAEKRSSRVFSPQAISRFYGALPEPLHLTSITPLGLGEYRVSYRYSAGRSRCDGRAVVSLTSDDGRDLIRSIRALNGC